VTTRAFDLAALDMAGTTVDEGGLVYDVLESSVADAAGEPVPHDLLLQWKGTSKWEAIQGLLRGLGQDPSTALVDKIFDGFGERLVTAYRETPPQPFPGVAEMFETLRTRGVKVALQTGYSSEIAAAILDGLGWTVGPGADSTVDAVVTSDLVAASRAVAAGGLSHEYIGQLITTGNFGRDLTPKELFALPYSNPTWPMIATDSSPTKGGRPQPISYNMAPRE
jgi:phosphonatase-like hydrolase